MTLREIRSILSERKLSPNPRFGQNFLHDENLARWIVKTSGASTSSRVLEIGPGLGAITEFFLESGAEVTAVEIDWGLFNFLKERFSGKKLKVILGDANKLLKNFECNFEIMAGNLPYNLSVPIIIKSAIVGAKTHKSVWMVQREIAQRLLAEPCTSGYGSASVVLKIFCRILESKPVGRKVFFPEPSVQSNIICLEPNPTTQGILECLEKRERFCMFVRSAFSSRRKMFFKYLRTLSNWDDSILRMLNLSGKERPEEISPEIWLNLYLQLERRESLFALDK